MPAVPNSDIVNVSISIADGAVQQAGFGTIMIVGQSTILGASEVLTATSVQDWLDADAAAAVTDEEYLALNSIFSQQPTVASVKVCRRSADTSAVQRVSFAADFQAAGTINISYTYTDLAGATITETIATPYNTSHAQTITDVTAALLALTIVTAATGTNTAPGARFDVTIDPSLSRTALVTFTVNSVTGGAGAQSGTTSTTTTPATLTDRLGTLAASEDSDWYCLLLTHVGTDAVRNMDSYRAAAWVEGGTIDAIYIGQSDVSAISAGTAGNVAKVLEAASYHRSHIFFQPESDYADAELAGRALSQDLDVSSIDWWRLRLTGSTVQTYTPTQRATLNGDSVGYYTTSSGTARYIGGKMASGRYIDQQLTVDWFKARVAEDIIAYLDRGADSNIKRTYTDATVADIAGLIRARWQNGVAARHFAATKTAANGDTVDGLTITKGLVSAQSSANRTARTYAGLSATVQLAGGIRFVNPLTIVLEV